MARVQMINLVTGTSMYVPADLVDKFLVAGHKLATAPAEEKLIQTKKPARKKTSEK